MTNEKISDLLFSNNNILYCSFEMITSEGNSVVVYILGFHPNDITIWQYVLKDDFSKYEGEKDHSVIKTICENDIIDLRVFKDVRLSRQKLQF